MDDSNSSPDPSFYGNPDTTQVLQVIWHTPENQQFLDYVRERQEAFERGAVFLKEHSAAQHVLMRMLETKIVNNEQYGYIKKTAMVLIDRGSAELLELLQPRAERPTAQPETDMPAESEQQQMAIIEESFYDGQPEWDEVIDNEQKLDDEWEPVVPRTKNIVSANLVKQKHALQIEEKPEEFDTIGPPQLKNTARPTIDAGCLLKNYGRAAFTSCDIIHAYLNSLAEKNLEASVLYSGCAQIKDKDKLKNYVKNLLDKPFIKFVIFALCHDEHWRILKISLEVIEEYDPLNCPIPKDVNMIIQTIQSIHHQPLKRLSEDRTKPKQEDGHNCGPFILGQGREWLIGTPWRRDSVPEMGRWRMNILAQLMDNHDCTNDNKLITKEIMDSYVQTLPPAQNLDQSVADQTPSAQEHGAKVGEATCKGYEMGVAFKDVTINIPAEDEFPVHIKIRAGKCKLDATFGDTKESLTQGAHTEETDPTNIQNTLEIENSSPSTNATPDAPEALTEGRKRKLDNLGQPPAKKHKTDVRFAILGVPASQKPTSRKPFSDFLNGHGFDFAQDGQVLLYAPLPSRIPKPKFIGLFSIPCKGLEDLILAWLEREDVITNLFFENKRKFGSETSRFKILAVHSDAEEIRIIQLALQLMEVFHKNQNLEMFRNVSTMNVHKIKAMLDSTPQQHIYTAYMKFSKAGRREIVNAFRAVTNIPTQFWNQIERMKESNV